VARIVVVEDEIQVLMLAESVVQQAGHDTVCASIVAEALALINSKHEKFDLVFADVELGNHKERPHRSKLVGEARSGVPVLYASGRLATDGMKSYLSSVARFCPNPTPLSS
jgi:CheY-like chemotaxis protein